MGGDSQGLRHGFWGSHSAQHGAQQGVGATSAPGLARHPPTALLLGAGHFSTGWGTAVSKQMGRRPCALDTVAGGSGRQALRK